MKISLYILSLCGLLFISCEENFNLETNTNTQFNVRVNGVELPVFVRGNTASKKIILFVNSGPGLTCLDEAHIDAMNFKSIETSYAIAYFDQRGTGNAQGVIKKESITLKQYSKDLFDIIRVLEVKYDQPDIFLMSHGFGSYLSSFFLLDYEDSNSVKGWINLDGALLLQDQKEWEYKHTFLENIANEEIAAGTDVVYWSNALNWTVSNPVISTQAQKDQWRNFLGNPGEFIIPAEQEDMKTRETFDVLFTSSYNPFPAYWSQNRKETSERIMNEAAGTNLIPELSRLELPSLFIWGRYDDLVPPELGQDAFDEMGTPSSDKYLEVYLSSGHQPFTNEPNQLTLDVVDFVGKH